MKGPGGSVKHTISFSEMCNTFWGTHGCHKRKGHEGPFHKCECGHWILTITHWPYGGYELFLANHLKIDTTQFIEPPEGGVDKQGYYWATFH